MVWVGVAPLVAAQVVALMVAMMVDHSHLRMHSKPTQPSPLLLLVMQLHCMSPAREGMMTLHQHSLNRYGRQHQSRVDRHSHARHMFRVAAHC